MYNDRKRKLFAITLFSTLTMAVTAMVIANVGHEPSIFTLSSDPADQYSLILNSGNKVTSSGEHITQQTALGNDVKFTYQGVKSQTSGHVTLNEGGKLWNEDIIHSVTAFTVTFEGNLQARICYVTEKWGDYFTLVSGQSVVTGTNPYHVELYANSGEVTINSVEYRFNCTVNSDAEEQVDEGSYVITFKDNGTDSSVAITTTDGIIEQVASGSTYIDYVDNLDKIFAGDGGLKFGGKSSSGSMTIHFDSSTVTGNISSVSFNTAQYGTDTGSFRVYANDAESPNATIVPADGGSFNLNDELTSLTIVTTSKRAYLVGITLNYDNSVEPGTPDTPLYEVGFTASDANKDTYTTNSIFDIDNALSVSNILSDSSQTALNPNDYSYVVNNPNGDPIDTSAKFPAEGTYTLVVSYKNFIPVEISLPVGEYVYIIDVSASMSTSIFTTADTLSAHLAGNLLVTAEYSNDTIQENISYTDLGEYGLAMTLLNPKGFTHDPANIFGTAGNWTVVVYSLTDANISYEIPVTVNAIPVQTITLSQSSASMVVEDTLQLTTTVRPNDATNNAVNWSSNNTSVATVSENGLVTAVGVGGATISATAADGSGVVGNCSITVTAKPQSQDVVIDATTTEQVTTNSTNTLVFTNSPVSVTIAKSSSSTNANNYVASGTNKHTRAYQGQRFTISGGDASITKIVIHGTSDKGVDGFTSPTWTNASKSYDGNEVTITPTDPESDVYCTVGGTVSFSGITVTCGSGAPTEPVYPTTIDVTGTSSISVGQTSQLSVSYEPAGTNVKNVTFSSSNENVATVSANGLVTGVAIGNTTITATAEAANSQTVTDTIQITVTPISVASVSLDKESATVKVGKTVTLVATVSPDNASNKTLNWSSSNNDVATVNGGVITGVSEGNATITVSSADGNKTATCAVTVTSSSSAEEVFAITYTDLPASYQTSATIYTAASGIKFQAYNCAGGYSSKMQFKASGGYLQNTEELVLQSLTINDRESNTLTVYGSNTAGSFSSEITGVNDVYDLTGYSYFKVAREASGAGYCSSITVLTGTPTPTNPTAISLNPSSVSLVPGGSQTPEVKYTPNNANQNKDVTWTSSNTNVATVDNNGLVTAKSTATAGQTATITAKLTNLPQITATCTVTIVEKQNDNHTVLIYMCGADLESKNGLASGDIYEILQVSNQPDDVNIVIETGGATSWASGYGYGINADKLERWHVENKKLVRDASLTYASMGQTSTLQSFIEYGLNNYPADRTGLVFWNHGGGMRGVCYDEKKNDDVLKNSEIKSAVSGALSNCDMSGQKLEWVGYDACLMAVQDIAETNSKYFNYMIASEESEAGYGWDYDNWVDDLYAKKSTETVLKAIVDSFIYDNGGASSTKGDQTLSYLDLAYAAEYKTAWENMAAQLNNKVTSSNKSSFNSAITSNVKHYADDDYDYFCTFDAWDFVDKLANDSAFSSFRIDSSYITAVKNAHANLVKYNVAQKGAGVSKGLCMYWPNSSRYSDVSTYYTTSETNFTTWRSFCVNKGTHA